MARSMCWRPPPACMQDTYAPLPTPQAAPATPPALLKSVTAGPTARRWPKAHGKRALGRPAHVGTYNIITWTRRRGCAGHSPSSNFPAALVAQRGALLHVRHELGLVFVKSAPGCRIGAIGAVPVLDMSLIKLGIGSQWRSMGRPKTAAWHGGIGGGGSIHALSLWPMFAVGEVAC